MNVLGLDLAHVVELGSQMAQAGAIRALELMADDTYEYTIGIAVIIYAMDPDG